jgi:hypothetical protein
MSDNITLGIDPGASGGIAAHFGASGYEVSPMPATEGDVVRLLRKYTAVCNGNGTTRVAYIEELVKHMGAGIPASTMAVYASNWGFLMGALMMDGWQVRVVRPQVWQSALGIGNTGRMRAIKMSGMPADQWQAEQARVKKANADAKREWKRRLVQEAQRRYPACNPTLKTADALLIMDYGVRQERGPVLTT